ncbi:MAG TPA: type II CAAX endopeptidase family protein [Saprospiraceae bacterium]|nr:type II CAAX endopeptidase family protein [Saprospiraceae bacterium]
MTGYDHFLKLLILIGFIIGGILLTAAFSFLILMSSGMSMMEIAQLSDTGMQELPAGLMRGLLTVQHLSIFILPGLAFGYVVYKADIWKGLSLSKFPSLGLIILGIVFLLTAYPIVNLSFLLNESIPLPSWANDFENQAAETLKTILQMNSPIIFLINLLLIAILPGVGEELLFRGIVQKHIGGWLKNPVVAIWISAFIFSAIHMQFEGFFPRLCLGAILGYLYYWTNNLWVPIITHAFNNGIQVVLIYSMDLDLDAFEQEGSDQLQWWMIPLSVAGMYLLYRLIIKNRNVIE